LQADGRILIGGRHNDFASLLRFQPNGLADNAYAAKTTLGAWLADDDGDRVGFALQPDGKAVVAVPSVGFASVSQGFFAVRLNTSGSADPSFSGDGRAFADYSSGDDRINDIALQPDGKIVVIGEAYSNYLDAEVLLARYTVTGQLDATFGSGGKKTFTLISGDNAYAYAVAVQPDGKIVAAAGLRYGPSPIQLKVLRFLPDGSADASFGTGGKVDVPGKFFLVNDLVLQPDGKMLLGGTLDDRRFAVVRLLTNGAVDTGFGTGGTAATTVLAGSTWPFSAGFDLLPDGRIVMGGCVPFQDKVAVLRLKANGQPDPSFSGDGKGLYDVPDNYYTYSFAVQPDGKILLGGGLSTPDYNLRFAVTRILADGSALDAGFGSGGNAVLDFAPKSTGYADALAVLPDGRIVAAGREYTPGRTRLATARLLANGKTESGTLMWTDLGGNGLAHLTEVAVQPDGRVLMGGMVRSATDLDFALLRYVPAPLVATHEQEAPALAVMAYPNPFSHTLRLDLSELPAPVDELWVYALDGRAMFSAQGLSASALDIGAQDWPAGVYVVRAFAAGRCFVQQVLK
ncbi:MAG TPA: hypothetical protein PKD78_05180, partial [Saprospiraceae bacterium]|nr:hypothetical protein [Saprospiraceae bacterium]